MKKVVLTAAAAVALVSASDARTREAYFGDLHLHTAYSFDAYVLLGTRATPDDAYRFARGEEVTYLGHTVKRSEPLDFLAVTDHSENIGVFNELENPDSPLAKSEIGQQIQQDRRKAFWEVVKLFTSGKPLPGVDTRPAMLSTWQKEIDAANRYYQPGKFTTLVGYEWSSMPEGKYNLHRNVIFRGDKAPFPFSSLDSKRPEDLWSYLEKNREQGIEALAIPHNANASGGFMYDWNDSDGKPIDQVYAQRRALNEPLSEISQNKGSSDTHPTLSANDEFANFEIFDRLLVSEEKSNVHGSYVREAYGRGLIIKQKAGANPYKFGVVGATDFHNALSTSSEEQYTGAIGGTGSAEDVPDQKQTQSILAGKPTAEAPLPMLITGSGNITGVWADENTREGIFDALRRKETFATSGPKIKVRFFGGWSYDLKLLKDASWVQSAYAQGTTMGNDLPARPAAAKRPRFVVWSIKDPNGANLERAQVIKVWLQGGGYAEKIYDVARGATELATVWEDPDFDPAVPAVYYLRVLEVPTPRWSTLLARKRGLAPPAPENIRERAWSSPIWYSP
jgi:Protein of unknown function (DUF3604)